jgi:signal transduction histidine kinase
MEPAPGQAAFARWYPNFQCRMVSKRSASGAEGPWSRGRWMPVAAILFVLVALVALALIPVLASEWFHDARRQAEVGILPALAQAERLALASERQVAAARGFLLSGDRVYRTRFEEARAAQLDALGQLALVMPRVGPAAYHHLESVRQISLRWQEEHARAMDGRTAVEDYLQALPRLEALRDSLYLHLDSLNEAITRAGDEQVRVAERALGFQRSASIALGALAFMAVLVVGWFARRQWFLTGRVEKALAEENRLREESERAREELVRVTESRARLMRGFGHDLKNPLGAADGYLQLLLDGVLGPLTDRQLRAAQRARRSIRGGLNLVEDLVDLARAETGHLEVARVPIDLREVVIEAADEYQAQAEAKHLELRLDLPEEFPLVATDNRRVRQILGNLVSNAVKYTDSGVVTIRLSLAETGPSDPWNRHAAIEVEDTGPGIPHEQQHLLFEEFRRLAPSTAQGVGLGLAISNRLAQALGGKIEVASEVGHGSTFTLLLPLRRSTDLQPAAEERRVTSDAE